MNVIIVLVSIFCFWLIRAAYNQENKDNTNEVDEFLRYEIWDEDDSR